MKVIDEIEITKCSECSSCNYSGESWSEDVYSCKRENDKEIYDTSTIPNWCPLIPITMEKLRNQLNK